ncbi:YdcF family protein [Candidatus Sumerlaeota bacterium]|nr:YdcF family protein [Candidatus Sumerlaeota bacterium]
MPETEPISEISPTKREHRWFRVATRAGGLLALTILMALGYPAASIFIYGFQRTENSADAAIVLGAAVWKDRASPVFRERIRHAIDLRQSGRVKQIIFTGGKGEPHEPAESIVARDMALDWGEPESVTLFETRSHNTFENLVLAREVMRHNGLQTALIVSDPPHMRRSMAMARGLGIDCAPSPTPTTRVQGVRSQALFILRETGNYLRYLFWLRFKADPEIP